jgi:hypothetical protein
VAAVGLLGVALPMQVLSPRLPEPIAVHWGANFEPNGSRPQRKALVPPVAIVASTLLISLLGAARAYVAGRAGRLAIVTFGTGLAVATRLDLRGGRQLFITVDDATTAARLLNGLLGRQSTSPGSPLAADRAR